MLWLFERLSSQFKVWTLKKIQTELFCQFKPLKLCAQKIIIILIPSINSTSKIFSFIRSISRIMIRCISISMIFFLSPSYNPREDFFMTNKLFMTHEAKHVLCVCLVAVGCGCSPWKSCAMEGFRVRGILNWLTTCFPCKRRKSDRILLIFHAFRHKSLLLSLGVGKN